MTLIKTTTDPRSTSRNNCHATGRTPRYILTDTDGIELFSSRRKRDCQEILDWVEAGEWDGLGDLQMSFDQRTK